MTISFCLVAVIYNWIKLITSRAFVQDCCTLCSSLQFLPMQSKMPLVDPVQTFFGGVSLMEKGCVISLARNLPSVAVTDNTAFATFNYNFLCLGV